MRILHSVTTPRNLWILYRQFLFFLNKEVGSSKGRQLHFGEALIKTLVGNFNLENNLIICY